MSQIQVKTFGGTDASISWNKVSTAVLPNGGLAFFVLDPNQPNTGGGSGNGNQYCHIYYQPPNSNAAPTFQQSWLYTNGGTANPRRGIASMTVDQSGNLHCVYLYIDYPSAAQSVRYRKLTWTGSAFTLGAEETVKAVVANKFYESLDIDIAGTQTTNPTVVSCSRQGTTTITTFVDLGFRPNSSSWTNVNIKAVNGKFVTQDLSLAVRKNAETGNNSNYVVAWCPGPPPSGTSDIGDFIFSGRFNTTTGYIAGSNVAVLSGINKNLNSGYRLYHVYEVGQGVFLVHGQIQLNKSREWLYIFKNDPASNTVGSPNPLHPGETTPAPIPAKTVDSASAIYYRFDRKFSDAQFIRTGLNKGTLLVYNVTASAIWVTSHEVDGSAGDWVITSTKNYKTWTRGFNLATKPIQPMTGDRGRHADYRHAVVMTTLTRANSQTVVSKVYAYKRPAIPTAEVYSPSINQVVSTSKPTVTLKVTNAGTDAGSLRARAELQISSSAAFTTELLDIVQPVSAESYYSNTPVNLNISTSNYPLHQTTWYARVRMLDQLGGISTWSPVVSFVVSHPPMPINTQPVDQQVLIYDPAGCTFSWEFRDAYSGDSQTAYEVDVYSSTDGGLTYTNSVATTGKVVSSDTSVTIVLGSGLLEQNVRWTVEVWDEDDVSSTPIDAGIVLLTQPPLPVITYPVTDGDIVQSAIPVVSWDPGLSGAKTQTFVRIMFHRVSDGVLIYDTKPSEVIAQGNSFTVPTGYLRNLNKYSMTLSVTDSTNLQTTVTRVFNTSWTPPDVRPAPGVFTERHDSHGFVAVTISGTGYDDDLVSVQLYRRAINKNPEWELVTQLEAISNDFTYLDYMCPAGITVEYLVTQIAYKFGELVESVIMQTPRAQILITNAGYWLIDKTDNKMSMNLPTIVADSFSTEIEESIYTVVGKGRVVEVGEIVGVTGTLSAQLRHQDRGWFNHENYNIPVNTNLIVGPDGNITGWTRVDDGALTPGLLEESESSKVPGPGLRDGRLSLAVKKGTATPNQISTGYEQQLANNAYFKFTPGQKYYMACWVQVPVSVPGYVIRAEITWRTGTTVRATENVSLSTDLTTLTPAQLAGTQVLGDDLWLRLGRVVNVPTNWLIDNAVLRIYATSIGSSILATLNWSVEAISLTLGPDPVAHFNGDTIGATWTNQENIEPAYNPGQLSARWMKRQLEDIKELGHEVYLRNPFGDAMKVYVGTLSISRVAGVGASEYVDVEVPYMEIG